LVLEPLRAPLGDRRTLILSPDSNLWLVPWAALPLEDGRLAIEEYTLRFVVCGRDLTTSQTADIPSGPGLVIADPEFGLTTEKVAARTAELDSSAGAAVLKRSPNELGAAQFGPLPGTRVEARAIAPALEAWSGQPPRVLLGEEAIEAAARQASNPRVLVLSTHGYFLPLQAERSNQRALLSVTDRPAAALSADGQPLENPLLRCGLAFAGANTRNQRADSATDDGILTGLEIVGMDLRGTELVVLSACETGLGDVRNGEGVAGLRQAFQLAGAEAVVATLWQIPDRDTAIIMGDFFANLAAGQSKAEALRNAQLKRIAERRERNGAAHPLFWAAFTLTGN
jgi:CHAT domain-containing protein